MTLSRGAEFVSVLYVLNGKRGAETLRRQDAYNLLSFIRAHDGVVYWFNPA